MGLYDPAYWNVNAIVHADAAESLLQNRTINPLERFNRKFNDAFASAHSKVPQFVETIKRLSQEVKTWTILKQDVPADHRLFCLSRSSVFLMTIKVSNPVNLLHAAGTVE